MIIWKKNKIFFIKVNLYARGYKNKKVEDRTKIAPREI